MLSFVITAYKEPESVKKCIQSIRAQNLRNYEIIVVAPDDETLKSAVSMKVKTLRDPGKGKPSALNLVFKKAKGSIIILTDGDVYLEKNTASYLVGHFKDKKIGAVTGRPVSLNPRNTMLGFWSHLLTDAGAHEERTELARQNKFIVCSGYLYAVRKGIVKKINENSLSDDAVISYIIWQKGYKIFYEPRSIVYVKYPTTLKDWVKQKRRSFAGYHQTDEWFKNAPKMRTFKLEIIRGLKRSISYTANLKELFYLFILFIVRFYTWLLTYYDLKIRKKTLEQIWQRVETTK